MNTVHLTLTEQEAKDLFRHLHILCDGQEPFQDAYRQLQDHFFQRLTIDELNQLFEGKR